MRFSFMGLIKELGPLTGRIGCCNNNQAGIINLAVVFLLRVHVCVCV